MLDQYTEEVSRGLFSTALFDQEPEEMWHEIKRVKLTAAQNQVPEAEHRHKSAWLSVKAIEIAGRRQELKASGASRESIQRLNTDFQKQARSNKEESQNILCTEIEAINTIIEQKGEEIYLNQSKKLQVNSIVEKQNKRYFRQEPH